MRLTPTLRAIKSTTTQETEMGAGGRIGLGVGCIRPSIAMFEGHLLATLIVGTLRMIEPSLSECWCGGKQLACVDFLVFK